MLPLSILALMLPSSAVENYSNYNSRAHEHSNVEGNNDEMIVIGKVLKCQSQQKSLLLSFALFSIFNVLLYNTSSVKYFSLVIFLCNQWSHHVSDSQVLTVSVTLNKIGH